MAGFEEVIQRAIEKHQPTSVEKRERVYNSARATLANMLENAGNLSPENALDQRRRLETAISKIELSHRHDTVHEPEVAVPDFISSGNSTISGSGPKPMIFWRRPFSLLLLGTIILAALGISAWWIYDQQLTQPAEMRDNSVPNPPKILEEESSASGEGNQNSSDWLAIFDPKDPTGIITPAGSSATLDKDENGSFIRLKAANGDLQRGFQFVIEPGILESIYGKSAVFEIMAKSSDSDNQQIVVTCKFDLSGGCGRKQFSAGQIPMKFTFEKNFSDDGSRSPSAKGSLYVFVDLSGKGNSLDLYKVSVKAR